MASRTNIAIGGAFVAAIAAVLALIPRGDDGGTAKNEDRGRAPATMAADDDDARAEPDGGPVAGDDEISVLSLVGEMADLDHLARLPRAPFAARQASSYDRRSRRPDDGDAWFANDDFATNAAPNLVRVETDPASGSRRYVLLDATGPGAIVRMWTAAPAGTLRIYIDDDPRPALEAPMGELLAGKRDPFVAPFGQVTAMGHSLYFPFPFRKRCLVVVDSIDSIDPFSGRTVDKLYYQIGYRQYLPAAATHVRPFSMAEVTRAQPAMARAAAALTRGRPIGHPSPARASVAIARALVDAGHPSVTTVSAPASLAPGGGGGGVITTLLLSTPERDPERLRATTLSIAFDGAETVRAPLVDFFGTGPGWNAYASLPMTVAADGALACRFRMPFRSRAVVTIAHEAAADAGLAPAAPVEVSGAVTVDARPFTDDTLLFHARFRGPERLPTRPLRDWHLATLDGSGQQVGTVLAVENPPGAAWWGEGDEKIFVDGEDFPSLFGTGTEDYFGFAWSSTETFAHPYHAQTLAPGGGFAGWFSMNRFLILDPVPFASRLRFDLELWHWSDTHVLMSGLLYWYARPGATDDFVH